MKRPSDSETTTVDCPKCGRTVPALDECIRCGVIFSKVQRPREDPSSAAHKTESEEFERFLRLRSLFYPDRIGLEARGLPRVDRALQLIKEGELQEARRLLARQPEPRLAEESIYWWTLAYVERKLGNVESARQALRQVLPLCESDSRETLAAWHLLRRLGYHPPSELASRVLGVVVEFGTESRITVVAGYADGIPWLLDSTGTVVFAAADEFEGVAGHAAERIVAVAQPLMGSLPKETDRDLPEPGWLRFTFLTPGGFYSKVESHDGVTETSLSAVAGAAQTLTEVLIATAKRDLPQPEPSKDPADDEDARSAAEWVSRGYLGYVNCLSTVLADSDRDSVFLFENESLPELARILRKGSPLTNWVGHLDRLFSDSPLNPSAVIRFLEEQAGMRSGTRDKTSGVIDSLVTLGTSSEAGRSSERILQVTFRVKQLSRGDGRGVRLTKERVRPYRP